MSLHTLKKLQNIDQKIHQLKQEQTKLHSLLEKKIIDKLHKNGAFHHDFETLLLGISHVLTTLNRTDQEAKAMRASWKNIPPL
jgi:hypothetical protein